MDNRKIANELDATIDRPTTFASIPFASEFVIKWG